MQNGHEDVVTSEGGVTTAEAPVADLGGQRYVLRKILDVKGISITLKPRPGDIHPRYAGQDEIEEASILIGTFGNIEDAMEAALKYGNGKYHLMIDLSSDRKMDGTHVRLANSACSTIYIEFEVEIGDDTDYQYAFHGSKFNFVYF